MLQILMPFIFFISSSALLAGALQAVGHFFVPAFSPILLNIVFIIGLVACMAFSLPYYYFCYIVLLSGFLQLIAHVIAYRANGFSFELFDEQTKKTFAHVMVKFFPMLISMGILEINMIIDTQFASYLVAGSTSLLQYGSDFMRIPLGVIGVSLSTTLLPHFARVGLFAPKRLNYYLLEASKFIWWSNVPIILLMGFFSEKIFHTLFLSDNFSIAQVNEASMILIAYLLGLFFYSVNKILLNLFYALHDTFTPTIVSLVAVVVNIFLNWILMGMFQATGLALATSISAATQTVLLLYLLHARNNFKLYGFRFMQFVAHYMIQLVGVAALFVVTYNVFVYSIALLPTPYADFLLYKIGFWFWAGPLSLLFLGLLWVLRKRSGLKLHFLD